MWNSKNRNSTDTTMKKLLLLIAAVGFAFLAACEKEPEKELPTEEPEERVPDLSLAGTKWVLGASVDFTGSERHELVFTATTVDYNYIGLFIDEGELKRNCTVEYVYYPPVIVIKDAAGVEHERTVGKKENGESFITVQIFELLRSLSNAEDSESVK